MANFFKSLFSSKKEEENKLNKTDKKNFDILKFDGVRAQKMGKMAYAIKCYTEALNIQEDFETMGYLTNVYTTNDMPEEALEVMNRMLTLEPEHINTLLSRINLLLMLDREKETIEDCKKVIELDNTNFLAYFMLAKAKRSQKDFFGGIVDLTKAISLKEDFVDAYLLRAEILIEIQQSKEALPDIEKVIELVPEEEITYLLRASIHKNLGDIEAALNDYQQVLDLNPFNEDASLAYASLLIEQGKIKEAITFLDDVIDIKPESGKAYSERGRAKNLIGDKEGAFEDLKKSIELDPQGENAQKIEGQHANFDNMYKGGIF